MIFPASDPVVRTLILVHWALLAPVLSSMKLSLDFEVSLNLLVLVSEGANLKDHNIHFRFYEIITTWIGGVS